MSDFLNDLLHDAVTDLGMDDFDEDAYDAFAPCKLERVNDGPLLWCTTHDEPDDAGHAFDNGRVGTLD